MGRLSGHRGFHAWSGILFNHESARRGETFVSRKITRAVARIRAGIQHNRASEVDYLMGDASKARGVLGLEPQHRFRDLARIMVISDIRLLDDELAGTLALAGSSGSRWMSGD